MAAEMPLPSRRAMLGTISALPAVLVAMPAPVASSVIPEPACLTVVATFREKYAAWLATIDLTEGAEDAFRKACATLSPEPVKPDAADQDDMLDKTLRELRNVRKTPEQGAAWAAYQREHTSWEKQRDALRHQLTDPAKVAYEQAYAQRSEAFDALISYRVTNLRDLGEKVEIIAQDCDGFDILPEHIDVILADVRRLSGQPL